MKINDEENEVFVRNLRKDPLYKFINDIELAPVNYLVANKKYSHEEIREFIHNSENINYNYEKFNKELEEAENQDDETKNDNFKILGYFSLDSKNNELIFIGKKYSFHVNLSIISIDKENLKVLEMPFYAIVTITENNEANKDKLKYKVNKLEFIEAVNFNIDDYKKLKSKYSTKDWFDLIITTLGYDPIKFTIFEKFNFLTRLIPYCTDNYNYIELGNFETAKSFFFNKISKRFSTLISAGKLSIAKLIYDNSDNENGLIVTKNVIAMDEFTNTVFKEKDIIPALQNYLEEGEVTRDNATIKGKASIVLLGNITDIEQDLFNSKCLFDQLKMDIDNPTFFDKLYHFSPGWKLSTIDKYDVLCDDSEERLTLDFFINSLTKLRSEDSYYEDIVNKFIEFQGTSSGRTKRIIRTVAGFLKILHPDGNVTPEEVEIYTYLTLCGRKLLLDQLHIKNSSKYTNSLYAISKTSNSEITPHSYYNLSILLSEKLFSNFDLELSNIEYYYFDYSYFDRSNNNSINTNGIQLTANAINKKLGFELIEPRLAIKFKGDEYIYKLALSTYGINANVIEYSENIDNNNSNIEYLNDSFVLIKSKNYTKPNSVHKLRHYSNVFWDKLKEDNKDNSKIMSLINIFESNNKNLNQLLDENIELKEKIENLENALDKNNEIMNHLINHCMNHQHLLQTNFGNIVGIDKPFLFSTNPSQSLPINYLNYQTNANTNSLTIFDYEKINKLREEYVKSKKTSQN